jgi:hypothetical protein
VITSIMRARELAATLARLGLLLVVCGKLAACDDGETERPRDAEPEPTLDAHAGANDDAARGETTDVLDANSSDANAVATDDAGREPCASPARCSAEDALERCEVDARSGLVVRRTEFCAAGARCDENGDRVQCVFDSLCSEGDSRCADPGTLAVCDDSAYRSTPCVTRCVGTPFGAQCAADVVTHSLRGRVDYEVLRPNRELTDWGSTPELQPGRGLWALSYLGEQLLDGVPVGDAEEASSFSLRVSSEAGAALVFMAIGADRRGRLAYAVADPSFASPAMPHTNDEVPSHPRLWSWRVPLSVDQLEARTIIRVSDGAGAVFVFDAMR